MTVEWPIQKLSDLVTKVGSGATPLGGGTVYKTSGTPFIRSMNVRFEGFDAEGLVYLDSPQAAALDSVIVRSDDVLLNITGASIGRVTQAPLEMDGARVNQHVSIIRPNAALLPGFLCCFLASPEMQRQILDDESGATRQALTKAKILAFDIPLPPVDEQRRIIAKLEDLRARTRKVRAALESIPALLQQYRQSVLAAAFRGELTAEWRERNPDVEPASVLLDRIRQERRARWEATELARMKTPPRDDRWKAKYQEPEPVDDSELPELPEGWCWASLRDVVDRIESGKSVLAQSRPAVDREYGVLKLSAVTWGEFDPTENKALIPGTAIDGMPAVHAGDLLITRANTVELIGAVVLVRQDFPNLLLSDKTLRLVPVERGAVPEFLLLALRAPWARKCFEEQATGTSNSMRNLSQDKILSAPVAVPPLPEQQELVAIVNRMLRVASCVAQNCDHALADLAKFEKSVLGKAFRGELVPQDTSEEPAATLLERIRAERASLNGGPNRARQGRLAGLE